jgi:uncharacterized lipoprotein
MKRITRFIAAASLVALLAACGGEGRKDREEDQVDRQRPSLGASKDDDEGENKKEEKESREDEDRDAND